MNIGARWRRRDWRRAKQILDSTVNDIGMWKFWKRNSTPKTLPVEGPWAVLEAKNGKSVSIIRLNEGYRECGSIPGYDYRVEVVLFYQPADESGLPSGPANFAMNEIEDSLKETFESGAAALFVATITGEGSKKFVFYSTREELARERFEAVRNSTSGHELQISSQEDKDWIRYRELIA